MKAYLLIVGVFLFSAPSWADLFKYRDENGNLHVVDSEDAVPEQFRKATTRTVKDPNARYYGDDPCKGKKMCGVAYLAPWCPHCRSALPLYKSYLKKNVLESDYAFKVVVGQERKYGANEEMARLIGYGALVDHSGKRMGEWGIKGVPSIVVLDESGKVVKRDGEAEDWIEKHYVAKGAAAGSGASTSKGTGK